MASGGTNPSSSSSNSEASLMGKRETVDGKLHCCLYEGCGATFKKLEHCQRHVRTHTLDRPYTCSHCLKSFARQDTLNRHIRLHTRKQEDGPTAKTGRKRKGSVSQSPATKLLDLPVGPNDAVTSSASGKASTNGQSVLDDSRPNTQSASIGAFSKHEQSQHATHGLPFSAWPVAPPSFPAYSKPYTGGGDELMPFDTAFSMPLPPMPPRRYSDNTYSTALSTLHGLHPAKTRPRANTLAEQLGSFSIVNSPDSSGLQSDSDDDDDDGDGGGDGEFGASRVAKRSKSLSSSSTDQPSTQYPSPAFTSYSSSELPRDARSDLDAILANDMLHQNNSALFPTAPVHQEDGFDLEKFAASMEGPAVPSNSALTLEDLFAAAPMTPPQSNKPDPISLQNTLDFDFQAAFAAADRDRLEKQAALARPSQAMYVNGYSMSNGLGATATSLPTQAIHMPTSQASTPPVQPHTARSYTAGTDFASNSHEPMSLSALYASSFPLLSTFPNGLGLSQSDPSQALLDVYRRSMTGSGAGESSSAERSAGVSTNSSVSHVLAPSISVGPVAPPTAALYIPTTSSLQSTPDYGATAIAPPPSHGASTRLNLPVPPWHREARDGNETREGFLVV